MKKISLLALLLTALLLFSSCNKGLPNNADSLVDKMKDKGYSAQQTIGEENITGYVEEYGLTLDDILGIAHAETKNENPNDIRLNMGTFIFCKDESTAISLKTSIENDLIEQFGIVNNPHYRNMTVEQKGSVTFYGTKAIWIEANE